MGILQARILEWVTIPFSKGSSRDQTQVSLIAGKFFTVWGNREAQESFLQENLKPEVELGYPALQVDSFAAELPGSILSCK